MGKGPVSDGRDRTWNGKAGLSFGGGVLYESFHVRGVKDAVTGCEMRIIFIHIDGKEPAVVAEVQGVVSYGCEALGDPDPAGPFCALKRAVPKA